MLIKKKIILSIASLGIISLVTACGSNSTLIQQPTIQKQTVSQFTVNSNYTKIEPKFYNKKYPIAVISHRGFSENAPENTMASMVKAYQAGADMVELDVCLSKDGQVVIMHDDTLERTTNGKGKVEDKTLKELKALDAGSWFSPIFKGEEIPTLEEILKFAKGKISVDIEIKENSVKDKIDIEKKVVDIVHKYEMDEYVVISSFSNKAVERVKTLDPKIPTAVIIMSNIFNSQVTIASKAKADIINEDSFFVTEDEVQKSQKAGIKVYSYIIYGTGPQEIQKLVEKGVDGILSNNPTIALRVLKDKYPEIK